MAKTKDQIAYTTDILLSQSVDWQVIRDYMTGRIRGLKLTEKQEEKMKRYQFVYNQLVTGKYTDTDIVNQLKTQYQLQNDQAYHDLRDTKELFGTVVNINKKFELMLQLEVNRKMLRKAEELCDLKAYASLEKNRAALIAQLPEEEPEAASIFEGHEIEPTFDPKLIGAEEVDMMELLNAINEKRSVKLKTELFEDIEHEDLDEKKTAL